VASERPVFLCVERDPAASEERYTLGTCGPVGVAAPQPQIPGGVMSNARVLANQKKILANQGKLMANQGRILGNQKTITANQKKILGNQKKILSKR
jgi:hypothetical protein